MEYDTFLEAVINEGIKAVQKDYADNPMKLDGAIAGFEACRHKTPGELVVLVTVAHEQSTKARMADADDYWKHRCYEAEIEWVCNCVSAVMVNEGKRPLGHLWPTARGVLQAAKILGTKPTCQNST